MLKSQMRKSGKRWRRWRCESCSYAWSTLDEPHVNYRNEANRRRRKLTDAQAMEIAASKLSLTVLSKRYGVTTKKIWALKHHMAYRDVLAHGCGEAPTCIKCAYWSGDCSFGFPEAGAEFAEECSMFEAQSATDP
jgi:hypothetical protein